LGLAAAKKRTGFGAVAGRLRSDLLARLSLRKIEALTSLAGRVEDRYLRRKTAQEVQFDKWASRLQPALARLLTDAARKTILAQAQLGQLDARLQQAPAQRFARLSDRLEALDRMRQTLGYQETLTRGYAVVRGDGRVVTSKTTAGAAGAIEIEFADGKIVVQQPKQGSLF